MAKRENIPRARLTGTRFCGWPRRSITASLMLRKLGVILARTAWSWPCASWAESNARCSSWTDWLQSVELRSAVHARLNKGEARNALARAGILQPSRQGQGSELRATTLPGQRLQPGDGRHRSVEHRVPGACHPGAGRGRHTVWGGDLLQYLSPLGWEHINLPNDSVWRQSRKLEGGKFSPLRRLGKP